MLTSKVKKQFLANRLNYIYLNRLNAVNGVVGTCTQQSSLYGQQLWTDIL